MQFVDLDERLLFRDDSFTPIAGFKREFRLYDRKKKRQFQEKLKEIYDHQRIRERVDDLINRFWMAEEATPELIEEYEKLDTEIVRAILAAAAAVGRKDFGYQRSPALVHAGLAIRMHKAIKSCITRGFRFNDAIRKLAELLKYNLPEQDSLNLKAAHANLNEAWKEKRSIEREDAEYRANWLEEIAEEVALERGTEAAKELKSMIAAARTTSMFKRLRAILKPEWSALDYIEVPTKTWYLTKDKEELYEFCEGIFLSHGGGGDDDLFEEDSTEKVPPDMIYAVEVQIMGDMIFVKNPDSIELIQWSKVTKPEEIENWLLRRNKRHLQQMYFEKSPPTTAQFEHILADYGTSAVADAILNGDYDSSSLQMGPEMEYFIKSLKMTQKERELHVPEMMPKKAFQELFQRQNEDTTTSPSGLHYTLWKAIAEIDEFADLHAKWVSIPFRYGFIIARWLKEIDCMLEKKAGVRKIHILRIIGLIEGDVVGYLKWCFNIHVMPNAERTGMTSNQWGGRKGRSAIVCALRKLVTWEYSYIFARKKGMPKNACKCRAMLVEKFERPVKTAAGISTATYKQEEGETRMGGEVLGKPDNMQLWTMQSDTLLTIHEQLCDGVTLTNATKEMKSRRSSADAYVDDADPIEAAPLTESPREAVRNITKGAQTWVNFNGFVGQALAFHKSFWQLMAWRGVGGYFLPKPRREFEDLNVTIQDHRGKSSKIRYKHVNEPNEGLGVKLCPDSSQQHEFDKREQQSKTIAARVAVTRFRVREAWIALTVNILPSVTYSFGITRFTKKQLQRIAVPLNKVMLPKLGINRNMKRIALEAPIELGGINYPSIETIQDQKNISLVLRQLQQGKELATDLRILISQVQLESGLIKPILDDTKTPLLYLEPGLIMHLRDRLGVANGSIVIAESWQPGLQRLGDKSIMEAIVRLKNLTKRQLEHINQCRKWLRVVTIAELASEDGKYISPDRLNGQWRAKSRLNWPRQPPPTKEMWDVFRRAIKRAFCKRDLRAQVAHKVKLDARTSRCMASSGTPHSI
jgi:hypothetical protein